MYQIRKVSARSCTEAALAVILGDVGVVIYVKLCERSAALLECDEDVSMHRAQPKIHII